MSEYACSEKRKKRKHKKKDKKKYPYKKGGRGRTLDLKKHK